MTSFPLPMIPVKVSGVETIIGHTFGDPSIVWEAIQTAGSGVFRIGNRRLFEGNKTLAMVGDAALKLVLVKHGYDGCALRGSINDAVSSTGSNANLARVGFEKGLQNYVCVNPAHDGPISHGMMATAVEAILGAVYVDSSMDVAAVKLVMTTLGLTWSG